VQLENKVMRIGFALNVENFFVSLSAIGLSERTLQAHNVRNARHNLLRVVPVIVGGTTASMSKAFYVQKLNFNIIIT
jgi:hypothetical protein